MNQALGSIEVPSWSASMAVLDRMEKAMGIDLGQADCRPRHRQTQPILAGSVAIH